MPDLITFIARDCGGEMLLNYVLGCGYSREEINAALEMGWVGLHSPSMGIYASTVQEDEQHGSDFGDWNLYVVR